MESLAPDIANINLSDAKVGAPKGPFWESVEQISWYDAFAANPAARLEKPVKYYFFKLKEEFYADEFPGPRYYPILLAPEIRKTVKVKRVKTDGEDIHLAEDAGAVPKVAYDAILYFVPKKYFRQWVYAAEEAKLAEKECLAYEAIQAKLAKEANSLAEEGNLDEEEKLEEEANLAEEASLAKKPKKLRKPPNPKKVPGWRDGSKFSFMPTPDAPGVKNDKHKPFTQISQPFKLVDTRDAENNVVPEGQLEIKLPALYQLLAESQESVRKQNGKIYDPKSGEKLSLKWSADKGWFYRFPNAGAVANAMDAIPKKGLYVKLHSNQVYKMHTPGGAAKSKLQGMYIPKGWLQNRTGKPIETDHETEFKIETDEKELGTIYMGANIEFWIRDQMGRPVHFKVENRAGREPASWTARYKTAIKSIETSGGWSRYLNPVLKIYLVPVDPDPRVYIWLTKCVGEAKQRRDTRQIPVVVKSEAVNKETHHLLGTSPLNDYETWIEKEVWNDYATKFQDREMPRSKKEIDDISGLITPEQRQDDIETANLANYHAEDIIVNPLSAKKIRDAKGMRDEVPSQKDVMGFSATYVAGKLNWTGYDSLVPGTGVWPAEWLHRSAFSWGGLTEYSQYATSQVRENLVFGSSECNSLMTRYEKCWQDLVKRFGSKYPNDKFFLTTNTRNQAYRIKDANNIDIAPEYKTWNVPRWVCYSLDYQLRQNRSSNEVVPIFATTFYPFQRGYFTSFEQELDSVVLDSYIMDYDVLNVEEAKGASEKLEWSIVPPEATELLGKRAADVDLDDEEWKMATKEEKGGGMALEDQPVGYLVAEELSYMSAAQVEVPEIQMNTVTMERVEELPPTTETSAQEIHQAVWEELHAPGPTTVDGIILENSQLVIATEDSLPIEKVAQNYGLANQSISALSMSVQPALTINESIAQDDVPPVETGSSGQSDSASSILWSPPGENSDIMPLAITNEDIAMMTVGDVEMSRELSSMMVSDGADPLGPLQVEKPEGPQQPQAGAVPDEFVLKGSYKLFGVLQTELYSLQSPNVQGVHHRISLPGEMSLGKLVPSLADSDMNAIKLVNTTITYRSHATETAPSGLSLSTSVYLSGFLQPINTVLRDVLGQDKPHIDMTGLLGTGDIEVLTRVPTPKGFTLRGELPGVKVNLFGIMDITQLGLDIMGTRMGSKGGYKYAYGFFGSGKIADASVDWYIMKYGRSYHITIVTQSDTWTNVGGITGINLNDVLFEASWTGSDVSSVALKIQASLMLRTGSLRLRGEYSQEQGKGEQSQGILEVSGLLQNCTLKTLCDIYEDIFSTNVTTKTDHEILFSALEFIVSTRDGLLLRGAVTVDGHTSANASIALSSKGIHITGDVQNLRIEYLPDIERASLDININKEAICVQLAATVVVERKHKFDVSLYLNKNSGEQLEYTVYGAYQGDFQLRNLLEALEGTFLDVSLQEVAICASNMETPQAQISQKLLAYDIKRGIQVYAKVASISVIGDLLRLSKPTPLTVCALYNPGEAGGDSKFKINMILPTENAFSIDGMKSGSLIITVKTTDNGPRLSIGTELFFEVDLRPKPLKLELELSADAFSAKGEARCKDMWDNPLGICKTLSVGNITAGLGIDYAKFFASGTPEEMTIGGDFHLDDFKGSALIHTGTNPKEQLLRLEITNLDLAALVSFVANIANITLPPLSSGKDTMFIKHLLVYVSTGMQLGDRFFSKGIEMDLDVIVFGKTARMHALVLDSKVAFSGSVQRFNIGDLEVTGARGKGDPYIDLEVSKDARKFHISGRVVVKDNYVTLEVHVDTGNDEFYFDFQLVIVDVLVVQVKATLEGSIPPAVKQIEAAAAPEAEKPVELPKDVLADRQFNLDAYVKQDIVNYIVRLANNHFEREGNPDHENVLKRELDAAESSFSAAEAACKTKTDQLNGIIASNQVEWDAKVGKATADREASQKLLDGLVATAEQEQRDLAVKIGLEKQQIGEQERTKTAALQEAAAMAQAAALDCKRQLAVLQDFKTSFEMASEARDAAEVELAACEAKRETHAGNEPALTDVAHTAWQWTYQELLAQRCDKIAKVMTAKAQLDVSKAMHDFKAYRETAGRLIILEKAAQLADSAFKKQESAAPASVKAAHEACDQKVRMLKAEQDGKLRYRREKLAGLSKVEAATKEAAEASMKEVKEANNPNDSSEYETLLVTRKARERALVAYHSFSDLVRIANKFGDLLTRPLRSGIEEFGNRFFSIASMRIKGRWGGKSSAITAQLQGTIGSDPFDFDITWDMTDIVDFLRKLWDCAANMIVGVIKDVVDVAKDVAEDIGDAAVGVGNAIGDVVSDVGEALGNVGKGIETAANDVEDAVESVVEDIDDALSDAGDAVVSVVNDVGNALNDAGNVVGGAVSSVVDDVGGAFEDIGNAISGLFG